jgi:hypothetical protein
MTIESYRVSLNENLVVLNKRKSLLHNDLWKTPL